MGSRAGGTGRLFASIGRWLKGKEIVGSDGHGNSYLRSVSTVAKGTGTLWLFCRLCWLAT